VPSTTTESAAPTAGAEATPLMELRGVSIRFGGIAAVSDVDLSIPGGEVRGLIGPNGAGKTTLFDTISGIRTPSAGSVWLDGVDVTSKSAVWRSRHGVRRTFQRQQTFGWLSVEDNVLAALEWRGGGGGILADLVAAPSRRRRERERRELARAAIATCGLTEIAEQPAGSLSIGKARMVEMARAIVDKPRLLILDEPTSGLEHSEAENLGETIQRVRADTGCSVLLVEHDIPFVMAQSDRITVLNLGQIIAEGSPSQIQENPAVREAYLG
jgi:branched-chain amino acid transport system ATP-binding protein